MRSATGPVRPAGGPSSGPMGSAEQPEIGIPSPEYVRRYGRHLILPGVGIRGQERLRKARVLVVGVGGLGAPVALYLAAGGVGELHLVDPDLVDLSNLHRQVIYTTADVGTPKVDAAAARLRERNPDVRVIAPRELFSAENAFGLVEGCDIVVDASDNFPTRYLVNDACVRVGRPDVFA